jgi:alpha-L-fucosidase 2
VTTSQLAAAGAKSFDALLQAHVRGAPASLSTRHARSRSSEAARQPTDERIRDFTRGGDPQLAALYFQFGRYMLISSSRPGSQPATLQGDWNDQMKPPWESKYTININTEMNYWPAESTNLSELVEPLTRLVLDLVETGARTAKVQYGAAWWVAHHNTDLWRASAPVDGPASGCGRPAARGCANALGAFRVHARSQLSRTHLSRAEGCVGVFPRHARRRTGHKWLVTVPSASPENRHPFNNTTLTAGPAMDMQILRDLFTTPFAPPRILSVDRPLRDELAAARRGWRRVRLARPASCRNGSKTGTWRLRTCITGMSRTLYALYPSAQITVRGTPALAPQRASRSRFAATPPPAGASAGGSICGRVSTTETMRTRFSSAC